MSTQIAIRNAVSRLGSTFASALVVLLVVTGLVVTPASAQDVEGFDIQRFHPATSLRTGYITLDSGQSIPAGGFEVGLLLHYANDPFVARQDGERLASVVSGQLLAHLHGAYAPIENLQLSLEVPVYLLQTSDDNPATPGGADAIEGAGIGDIRFTPKYTFLHQRTPGLDGFDLALLLALSLPTGDESKFQGGPFSAEPRLAADYATASGFGVGINLGFLIREARQIDNLEVGNQLTWGVAGRVPIIPRTDGAMDRPPMLQAIAELTGALAVGADDVGAEETPIELLLGGRLRLSDWYLTAGAGTGLNEGVGSPDYRLFLGLAYSAGDEAPDRDRDGYIDEEDACPDDPEDFDDFEDDDGCPDPDNDEDGILDVDDGCPDDAEDMDGFEDDDGCPDPDNDRDGFLDPDDACPNEAEDVDGFEDDDGCPDGDNDEDGVPDAVDDCPQDAEDIDGYEDEDGCPEEGPAVVHPERIEITSQIQFDYDDANLQPESRPILDGVAQVLIDNPQIRRVRIEGHTSTEGTSEHNLDLSRRRAQRVLEALVERGVERDRLVSEGYGETNPLEPDESIPGAAERNRRVEFHILERSE